MNHQKINHPKRSVDVAMRKRGAVPCLAAMGVVMALAAGVQGAPPLTLIQTVPLPGIKHFEHFEADPAGNRLFCLGGFEDGTLEVFDLRTTKHIRTVTGLQEGQQMVYRQDVNRLYIVGGGGNRITTEPGKVWIYDGRDYRLIKSLDVPLGPAWCGYDSGTNFIYVNGNGKNVKKPFSTVTVIDSTSGEQVAQFTLDGDTLTDFRFESSNPHMYVGEKNKKVIAVIDRNTQKVIETWPLTLGEGMTHMALDRADHRLFVSCQYGQLVVFDTQTGKELQALPINQYADDLQYDPAGGRLYVGCAGPKGLNHSTVDVIQQIDADHYKSLGQIVTEPGARNMIFVPQISRLFVSVPQHGNADSHILVFKVR